MIAMAMYYDLNISVNSVYLKILQVGTNQNSISQHKVKISASNRDIN